ncbi:hypothetical protein [Fulvivirga sp. M361]|uniref:hypothetical protein n=1 Tax=Fulvivirga sp. M361 TaxID=2594266 RepID=UPI001625ED8B|nr:hypothetical protein [Fulvivirga sp. M361]
MKLKDKYKVLSSPKAIKERIVRSVYASMMLEGQGVSLEKLQRIYDELKANPAS